jgi:hypothetical protein
MPGTLTRCALVCFRYRRTFDCPPIRCASGDSGEVVTGCSRRCRMFIGVAAGGLAVFGVAVVAGCGGSSSKASPSVSSKASASSLSSRASATPSVSPVSAAQLAKLVMQPGDLPTGWERTPYKTASNDPASVAFARCVGVPNSNNVRGAEAHSEVFTQGDSKISSAAFSFWSKSAVDSDTAALRGSKASPSCLEKGIKQQVAADLPIGATVDSVSVKITPGSAGGQANVIATLQGTVKASMSGEQAMLYLYRALSPVPRSRPTSADLASVGRCLHP